MLTLLSAPVSAEAGSILVADSGTGLWSIDSVSGLATFVGSMGINMYDIALTPGGLLFGVTSLSTLYSINPSTAAVASIGPVGVVLNGLAFDGSGNLYGFGQSHE